MTNEVAAVLFGEIKRAIGTVEHGVRRHVFGVSSARPSR
jgi:hypothetical protein